MNRQPGYVASAHPLLPVKAVVRVSLAGTLEAHVQGLECALPRPTAAPYEAPTERRLLGPAWDKYARQASATRVIPVPPGLGSRGH